MCHAQKCANDNSSQRRVMPCFLETTVTQRKMGQNIYFGGGPAENAVVNWYEEIANYDFTKPGFQPATGRFTAAVWYDTTHVGMARSACGQFLVANYFPAGNWEGEDSFKENVLPLQAAYAWRPRNEFEFKLGEHFQKLARSGMPGADGMQVPLDSLVSYLQSMGEPRLADAITSNDADGDGKIHAGEFIAALCTLRHSDTQAVDTTARRIVGFVSVDANGDGLLDEQEFLRYLTSLTQRRLTEQDAREILKQFDADGNGKIDYMELMALHDSGLIAQLNDYAVMKGWDKTTAKAFKDVPLREIVDALRVHLQSGGEARVLKTENQLIVKLLSVSSTGHQKVQLFDGCWDPATGKPVETSPSGARRKR